MTCDCRDTIHLNDYGTQLKIQIVECDPNTGLDVAVDLSAAITLQIILKPPVAASSTKTALVLTPPGTDGWIYYTTQIGDINEVGRWKIQAYAAWANGAWRTAVSSFPVEAII